MGNRAKTMDVVIARKHSAVLYRQHHCGPALVSKGDYAYFGRRRLSIIAHQHMPTVSLGQLEARISEAMIKFEREHMGRGPFKTRTFIIKDMIVVRLEGVLTPAELQLAKEPEGVKLLKDVRQKLIENAKDYLKTTIKAIVDRDVVSMYSDISSKTGERIIVFTLNGEVQ